MNKSAIIRTQLTRQLKALGLFLIFYCIILGAALVFNEYGVLNFDFEVINYLFIIYLVICNWFIFSNSLLFYSYHSFGRLTILNRTVIVQFITSFIASLLIEGHYLLMKFVPGVSNNQISNKIREIYINDIVSNDLLRIGLMVVIMTLIIYCLLLLGNLILLIYYGMKRKKAIGIIGLIIICCLALFISRPFWPNYVSELVATGKGYVLGSGQDYVPSIVIPVILFAIIGIISYCMSRKWVKRIEVYKNISM